MTKGLFIGVAILAVTAVAFSSGVSAYLFSGPPCAIPTDVLSDFDRQGLSVLTEMNKFVISVTLVIAGLAGGLVFSAAQGKFTLSIWSVQLLFVSFTFAIVSLYFGYVSYSTVFDAMVNKCIDLTGQRLKLPRSVQYYSMLAALVSGIGVVIAQVAKVLRADGDS